MLLRKSPRRVLFILLTAALTLTACNVGGAPTPTIDANALSTAMVETTIAQVFGPLTQTAQAASPTPRPTDTQIALATFALNTEAVASPTVGTPPTVSFNSTVNNTPLPGFTPIATSAAPVATTGDACLNSAWVADIGVQDGDVIPPGDDFTKTWRVQNIGDCNWDEGFTLVYIGGSSPNLDPVNFNFTRSNDFVAAGETKDISVPLTAPCTPGKYEGTWRLRSDGGYFFGTLLSVYIEVKESC